MLSTAAHPDAAALQCPLCGGAGRHVKTMPVDAKTFQPTALGRVYRCADCRFEYLAPRPSAEETSRFYDIDRYYTHSLSPSDEPAPRGLSRLRTHIAWRFDRSDDLADVIARRLRPGASIVDIGCGDGSQLTILAGRGYQMTGVERDTRSVSLQSGHQARVVQGSAEALPAELQRGSYDAAMFRQVLEHLVNPVDALRQAAQLLKPGGVVLLEVPNAECAIALQSGLSWEHMDVPRHVNFFTVDTLSSAVQRAGLRVESSFFNEYCRYFSDTAIATDQRIFDHLGGAQPALRYSPARAWGLLWRTALAPRRVKYDCLGIVAVKDA